MTFDIGRRSFVVGVGTAALASLGTQGAWAQAYPSKTIRMIVPFPAGGPTDIVARPIAQLLGAELGQTIFIDNRGGAGGSIGADAVAKSAPDGYTLLMGTVGTSAINPTLYKRLPYDAIADFTPIATVAGAPVAVVANPAAPFHTLRELVERARSAPNTIAYGSAGNGTPGHLAGALFCTAADIKLLHVPYKGSAPAISDLLGGQIPLMFDPLQSVLPHVIAGKLQALAVTSSQRASLLPSVPTVAESGWKDFETTAWWAVYGPAKLPPDVQRRLSAALRHVVESPEFASTLSRLGVQPMSRPLAEFQKSEILKWGAAVRSTGLSLE